MYFPTFVQIIIIWLKQFTLILPISKNPVHSNVHCWYNTERYNTCYCYKLYFIFNILKFIIIFPSNPMPGFLNLPDPRHSDSLMGYLTICACYSYFLLIIYDVRPRNNYSMQQIICMSHVCSSSIFPQFIWILRMVIMLIANLVFAWDKIHIEIKVIVYNVCLLLYMLLLEWQ